MRVGLNLLYLIPGVAGGTETYARGLLEGLAKTGGGREFHVFFNREAANWPLPEEEGFRRVVCPVNASSRAGRYLFEQTRLPGLLAKRMIDVVHSLGYVSPLFSGRKSVVTIHDVNFEEFGDLLPRSKRLALPLFVRASARRANHVLTISEFSRREICRHLGLAPGKVTVTHLAAGARWFRLAERKGRATTEPYIVAFSSAGPNKNIGRLIEAYHLARSRGVRQRLVLVGYLPSALTGRLPDGVSATGYIDPERLMETVAGAEFLVFPSLYEGFGLPVLEAMAAGVPVLCSNRASLPEVAGEAALLFDPSSPGEIADRICEVAADAGLRARMRERGLENAGRFSWERTASETLAVYDRVCSGELRTERINSEKE